MKPSSPASRPAALDLRTGRSAVNDSQDHLNMSSVSPLHSNRDLLHLSNISSSVNHSGLKYEKPPQDNDAAPVESRLSFSMKYGAATPKPSKTKLMPSSFRRHMTFVWVEEKGSDEEAPVFDEHKEFEGLKKQDTRTSKLRKKKSLRNKSLLSEKEEISSDTFESEKQEKSFHFYEPNGMDLSERSRSFEFWRRKLTISRTNALYQVWKGVAIIISFLASFKYGLAATFLHKMSEEDQAFFETEDLVYVSIFLTDMIVHMALDEHPYQDGPWTLKESLQKQIKNGLLVEVLSILPLSRMCSGFLKPKLCQLLYMVRCIRIFIGLDLLDYKKYKHQIQEAMNKRMAHRILDPEQANDQTIDSAKMDLIVMITQILKTFRLIILILCLSYFTGLAWFVFCQFGLDNKGMLLGSSDPQQEYFVEEFGFEDRDKMMTSVSLAYFIFTTLSTVGFGDFHPKSNGERIVCSFVMLFGVMIASVLMDSFSTMLKELQSLNKNYEETERFNIFLGTMKRYNGEFRLPDWLEQRMENYLQYRWVHNRNQAISTDEDNDLFEQLPGRVQTQIYVEFLFKHFMEVYKNLFDLHQYAYGIKRKQKFSRLDTTSVLKLDMTHIDTTKYFSHFLYDEFIVNLVRQLEPIEVTDGQILLRQDVENVSEIYLMMKGEILGGYNHKRYILEMDIDAMEMPLEKSSEAYNMVKSKIAQNLVMKMQQLKTFDQKYFFPTRVNPGFAIGLFEVEFGQQSQFLYQVRVKKTSDESRYRNDCYFIRKSNWFKIQLGGEEGQKEWSSILSYMKSNIMINYLKKVHIPIQNYRNRWLSHENRRTYEEYKRSANKTNLLKPVPGINDKKITKASAFQSTMKPAQAMAEESDNGDELMHLQSMQRDTVQQFDSIEQILDQIRDNQLLKVNSVRHQMNLFHIRKEMQEDEDQECIHQIESIEDKINAHQEQVGLILAEFHRLKAAHEELRRENLDLHSQLQEERRAHMQKLNFEKRKTEALRVQILQLQGEALDRKGTLNMQLPHNITETDPKLANPKFIPSSSKPRLSEANGRDWDKIRLEGQPGQLTARPRGCSFQSQDLGFQRGMNLHDKPFMELVEEEQSMNQSRLVGQHLSHVEYSMQDISLDEQDQDIFHIQSKQPASRQSLSFDIPKNKESGQIPEFVFATSLLQKQESQETLGAKPESPEKYDAQKPLDEEFGFAKIDHQNGPKTDKKQLEHLQLKFKFGENQDRNGPFVIQIDNESPDKVKLLDEKLVKAPTMSQSRNVNKIQEETMASNRSVTYDFVHTTTAKQNSSNHIKEEAGGCTLVMPSMGEAPASQQPPSPAEEESQEPGLSQSYSLPGVTQHYTANFASLLKSQSSKDEGFVAKNTLKGQK